ncbi:amidase domain-containing protein [Streptomyces ficellus]|uniref:Putative amidase domain-containing protein n=1 Tax=Streptomyces ficellus TaxID=1977088 RepID=A0A6I6FDT2_9ACTN|nr:amidase domain-containing protein [Streptomyces ficellus]QGV77235.1 hypothetical protein EIZ62_02435 [Streptomyces ficellus]
MQTRGLGRRGSRASIVVATAVAVAAGVGLLPGQTAAATEHDTPRVDATTRAGFQRLATAVLTDRTQALVGDTRTGARAQHRQTTPAQKTVTLSPAAALHERAVLDGLRDRRARLAALGETYSKGATSVTVDAADVNGRRATVRVTETTTLTYAKARRAEPTATGFRAHHELTFQADRRGDWLLTAVRDTDGGQPTVNQVTGPAAAPRTAAVPRVAADAPPNAPRAATTWPAAASPKNLTTGAYDYKAMAAYAQKYWRNYNPAYPSFDGAGAGGDCTNFVSQSLKAGGWKHVPGYVYDWHKWFGNADIQSHSFVGVNEFSWFALSSQRVTSLANVYQMDIGDVLQIDFDKDGSKDHTMVVTSRSAQGVPYLTYHSVNTYSRSVTSILASHPTAAYYAYRT